MATEPTNAHKCIKVSSKDMPRTCFGHSCGHSQGGVLQRLDIYRDIRKVSEPMHKSGRNV